MPGATATTARRRRRPSGETRAAILRAAAELFAAGGFQGTRVRDVAMRAGVSEALVFRHFETKDELFREAVIAPYRAFVTEFIDEMRSMSDLSNREMVEGFVRGLHGFMVEHRDLLFALVVANRFGMTTAGTAGSLGAEVGRLAAFAAEEAGARGVRHHDLEMMVACTIAMVLSAVVLDDVLFSPDGRPDDGRLVQQMSLYALGGVQDHAQRVAP